MSPDCFVTYLPDRSPFRDASRARLAHRIGYLDRRRDEPEILESVGDLLLFGDYLIADRMDAEAST